MTSARQRLEDPIHIAIKNYLEATLPHGWIVHHVRNEGMSKAENGRAKALGAKKGWPDLEIMGQHEDGRPGVWFIEVKAPGNYATQEQRELHDRLEDLGFKVGIARSIDDAQRLVLAWDLPTLDISIQQERAA